MSIEEIKDRCDFLRSCIDSPLEALDQLEKLDIIRSCVLASLEDDSTFPVNLASALNFFETIYEHTQMRALLLAYEMGKKSMQ